MKATSTKPPTEDTIEAIEKKVDKITYDIPVELLKECEWIYPLKENTRDSRVMTFTINAERQAECYHLNHAKLEFLKALRDHNGN